jgi:Family of unknown function (DUF6524)
MLTHSQRDGMLVCEAGQRVGGLGLLLANAFLAALYWLVASWGWLPSENIVVISWRALFSIAGILTIGMSWTRWAPRFGRTTGMRSVVP